MIQVFWSNIIQLKIIWLKIHTFLNCFTFKASLTSRPFWPHNETRIPVFIIRSVSLSSRNGRITEPILFFTQDSQITNLTALKCFETDWVSLSGQNGQRPENEIGQKVKPGLNPTYINSRKFSVFGTENFIFYRRNIICVETEIF